MGRICSKVSDRAVCSVMGIFTETLSTELKRGTLTLILKDVSGIIIPKAWESGGGKLVTENTSAAKFPDQTLDAAPKTEEFSDDHVPKPSRVWVALLIMATIGVYCGWFGPLQILLPAQADEIAQLMGNANKETILATVAGIGAAASMIANPTWGILSDRAYNRRGSRVPVAIAGMVIGVIGLVWLSFSITRTNMILGWLLVQIGLNGPFAVFIAFVADRVPERMRGTVGGLFGMAQMAGAVLGTLLAVLLNEERVGYIAVAIAVPLLVIPITVLHNKGKDLRDYDPNFAKSPEDAGFKLENFRIDSSFAGAFLMRFFMNLVSALMLLYLFYFIQDRFTKDGAGDLVLILTVIYVLVSAIGAAGGGVLSDKMQKRKLWVVLGGATMAVGAVMFAYAHSYPLLYGAVMVFAIGWGFYLAVDVGIITSALPDKKSAATMLGIANLASASPQVLAPVMAAPIVLHLGGYTALYIVTAVLGLIALIFLPMVKKVR